MTEFVLDSYPFVDGVDYVSFHQDDLRDKVNYFLENDIERNRIAENGYNSVRRFTRDNTLSYLLHCIEIDLADKRTAKKRLLLGYAFYRIISIIKRSLFHKSS